MYLDVEMERREMAEEGAEHSVAEGDDRNEAVYEVIDRLDGIPDPCLQSHFDYGTRAGTIILVGHDGQVSIHERRFGPEGLFEGETVLVNQPLL